MRIEFTIPSGADRDAVDGAIAKALVALSDMHRAMGGSGLKILSRDWITADEGSEHENG